MGQNVSDVTLHQFRAAHRKFRASTELAKTVLKLS